MHSLFCMHSTRRRSRCSMINFFGHGAFPSAVWWKWRLGCFLFLVFSLRFFGCGRRRETRFGFFCVAPQVACRRRSHMQIATSLLQSLFCTHSTWRRSRCNIKRPRGGSLHAFDGVARAVTSKGRGVFHSAVLKDCCVVQLATLLFLVFFFGGFLSQVLCVAAVDGRHTSSSSASRRKSLADRHLSLSTSRLLPCTRCSARSGRARRSRCKMQMSEGGFCRSALRDCWLLELTSELFSCVFGLFSFRLFLFFFFGCGILSLSSATRLLVG